MKTIQLTDEQYQLLQDTLLNNVLKMGEVKESISDLIAVETDPRPVIEDLRKENNELRECIEKLVSNRVSLQRKALKQKTNIIKAHAINEFKNYIKSGLKVINEPEWNNKRKLIIDDSTYFEMTLSEFDDYANKLRGVR
jgi:hypothetical protein